MPGPFGGLYIGQTGLNAQRTKMEVIGENIANVDTEGYHRRRVELSPINGTSLGVSTGVARLGAGVQVDEIVRLRNELLATHAQRQEGLARARDAGLTILNGIEAAYGGLTPGGFRDQMADFFNSFDDLASSPEDLAVRSVVLQKAETVSDSVNLVVNELDTLFQRTYEDLTDDVDAINQLSVVIAELNDQVKVSESVQADFNGLLDQRDRSIDRLASLADITVVPQDDGQVTISLDGQLLVSTNKAFALDVDVQPDAALTPLGFNRVSVVAPDGRELRIRSGETSAKLSALSDVIPDARRNFDLVTTALVDGVNALHQGGTGLDGSTGLDVFAYGAQSGTIEVSADVAGLPERLGAAAAGSGRLDNSVARSIAQLAENDAGPVSMFITEVGSLAGRVLTATSATEAAEAASLQAARMAQSEAGVSLDEELTDLITAQRAYEAAARVITTVDEMLQTLLNTGLVGR